MKNQVTDKRHAESASATAICSADAPDENAERDYAKYRADEVEKLLYGLGIRKNSKAVAWIVEREIREAVQAERDSCSNLAANFYNRNNLPSSMVQETTALDIAIAICQRNK